MIFLLNFGLGERVCVCSPWKAREGAGCLSLEEEPALEPRAYLLLAGPGSLLVSIAFRTGIIGMYRTTGMLCEC